MAEEKQAASGSVFISYSRKDKAFVQQLNDALDNAGVQAWVDWEGIELASDWMETITNAIQGTDAFIFVISPDSLKSKVCTDELEVCLQLNKKLIPVLYREPTKTSKMHEKIASTNWVYLRKQDNFDETIPKLVASVNTDLGWVRQHTRLLERAAEWEKKNKNKGYLLQGGDLSDAERWMVESTTQSNRNVLPIQAEYIQTSRRVAVRNQGRVLIAVSFLALAAIVLGIFALFSRNLAVMAEEDAKQAEAAARSSEATAIANEHIAATQKAIAEENQQIAEEKTNLAKAERSAAEAQILQSSAGELNTSTLLAIDAYNRIPSFQAENLIRINSSWSAVPVAQMKQDGAIWNIEWSSDYQFFVTGNNYDSASGTAKAKACVWRASNGENVYCVEHENDVNDAIFTKDGKYLITASTDQTVKFWNASDGEFIKELTFGGAILDLDVSDSVLAIGREDDFLTLYYLNKPDLKPVDVEQKDGVKTVKFSPNGEFLAFGLQNGQVKFWQARNNFFYNGPTHLRSSYVVLAWSPDNNWVVSGGGDSRAKLTKRDGSFQYDVTHEDWVEGVAFGPDASWYATVSDDNIVRVVNTTSGTEKFRMSHTHFAQRVIISPDGQWIASTGYDHVVRIWDSISGSQVLEIPIAANGSAISFNQDNSRIVVADENGNIGIWDISTLNSRVGYIQFTEFVREAHFSPSGEYLIVNADDYNLWEIPANEIHQFKDGTKGKKVLTAKSLTYNTAISPDSKWIVAVEYDSEDAQKNRATLVSVDGKTEYNLEHGGRVRGVAFTADSQLVISAGTDGYLWFWDVQNGERQFSLNNSEELFSMTTSPVNTLAFAGLHDKIVVWNTATKEQIAELRQAGDIRSITVSSDGRLLATGSSEGSVALWKVEGNAIILAGDLLHLNGIVESLAFSPNSQWLAGGGSTGFAYLWDVSTFQEMARIPHGNNRVTSVAFSPDGTQLLTVSRKVVRIWNISAIALTPRTDLIPIACSHLTANFSQEDWVTYFSDEEYQLICPTLPIQE